MKIKMKIITVISAVICILTAEIILFTVFNSMKAGDMQV